MVTKTAHLKLISSLCNVANLQDFDLVRIAVISFFSSTWSKVRNVNGKFGWVYSLQPLVNDINMVWSALSLPVLEPLTSAKMEKLSTITMSCLYAAVSIATANSILGISSAISPKTAISTSTTGTPPSLNLVASFTNYCVSLLLYAI